MNENSLKETIAVFDKENGGNPILYKGWYWLPSGARREQESLGALIRPPSDEFERLQNVVFYHKGRLELAKKAFHDLRAGLSGDEGFCAIPNDMNEAEDQLRKLQKAVKIRQTDLELATRLLDETPEGRRRAAVRNGDAESAKYQQEFRDRVRKIKI